MKPSEVVKSIIVVGGAIVLTVTPVGLAVRGLIGGLFLAAAVVSAAESLVQCAKDHLDKPEV